MEPSEGELCRFVLIDLLRKKRCSKHQCISVLHQEVKLKSKFRFNSFFSLLLCGVVYMDGSIVFFLPKLFAVEALSRYFQFSGSYFSLQFSLVLIPASILGSYEEASVL